jgi:hexosaminidase
MTETIQLLPKPKQITTAESTYHLPSDGYIVISGKNPRVLLQSAARFEAVLWKQLGFNWETVVGISVENQANLQLQVLPDQVPYPQGYRIHIGEDGISIFGHDEAGVFYGVITLIQVLQQTGRELPCMDVFDWPDILARGVMLDISRDKVYRMETLYDLVDRMASWKINQLQLYTEHTFAYRRHPEVWKDSSPMTGEEILYLDQFCQDRHIELVANQNSFGHLERWLKHPQYAHLAEIHGTFEVPWGTMKGPFSLAPTEPGSLDLINGLFDELLPHFSSPMVNIGCDETFDLGYGKSKALCEQNGTGQVYLSYLLSLYANLAGRKKTMQFWGDIILLHPDLVSKLPRDVIALEWGYEADHPFDEHSRLFAESGIPFYVCPGTSAWNTLAGRTDNCLGNLRNAAVNGLKNGAIGFLNTDWGDNGHWQVLPVSYLGYAMGAAYAWSSQTAEQVDVKQSLSRFAFDDPTGSMGTLAYELGNVYRLAGYEPSNQSALFVMLQQDLDSIASHPRLDSEAMQYCLERIDEVMANLQQERMTRPDASLIRDEYRLTARLMQHACQRGLLAAGHASAPAPAEMADDLQDIIQDYRKIWLKRNRPGGLADSIRRFIKMLDEYKARRTAGN